MKQSVFLLRFSTLVCGFLLNLIISHSFATGSNVVVSNKAVSYKNRIAEDYIIGVDDRIQVSVWRNPDLSITVPVRPDGKISTPLVGDVRAAGITPMQLAEKIKTELSVYIREPHVSIIVVGLSSHEYISRVRVTGAVRSPVSLPHRKGMTLLDLVLAAGGTTEFAAPNKTVLYRTTEQGKKSIKIRLDDVLKRGKIESNYVLQPGDVVTVPEGLF